MQYQYLFFSGYELFSVFVIIIILIYIAFNLYKQRTKSILIYLDTLNYSYILFTTMCSSLIMAIVYFLINIKSVHSRNLLKKCCDYI